MDFQEEMRNIINESQTATEDVSVGEATEEVATDEQASEIADVRKPFITVKHAKTERELTEEEAITAIQIGLSVKDKGGIENLKRLESKAKSAGYDTINEYLDAIDEATLQEEAAQMEAEEFVPQEYALEIVKSRKQKAIEESTKEQTQKEAQIQQQNEERLAEEVREFKTEFPDVDITKLPKEVLQAKRDTPNKSISDLYLRWERKQSAEINKIKEQQDKNANSNTGNLASKSDVGKDYYDMLEERMMKK